MVCSKCGAENPDSAKFCSLCGEAFGTPQARTAGYCRICRRNVYLNKDSSCTNGHTPNNISGIYEVNDQEQLAEKKEGKLPGLKALHERKAWVFLGLFFGICVIAALLIPGILFVRNHIGDNEQVAKSATVSAFKYWRAGVFSPENGIIDDDFLSSAVLLDFAVADVNEIGWKDPEEKDDNEGTGTRYLVTMNLTFQSQARTKLYEQKRYYVWQEKGFKWGIAETSLWDDVTD